MLQAAMRTRGCKEEFVPNPELLQDGKVRLQRFSSRLSVSLRLVVQHSSQCVQC